MRSRASYTSPSCKKMIDYARPWGMGHEAAFGLYTYNLQLTSDLLTSYLFFIKRCCSSWKPQLQHPYFAQRTPGHLSITPPARVWDLQCALDSLIQGPESCPPLKDKIPSLSAGKSQRLQEDSARDYNPL